MKIVYDPSIKEKNENKIKLNKRKTLLAIEKFRQQEFSPLRYSR
jgi:hypothetical protein